MMKRLTELVLTRLVIVGMLTVSLCSLSGIAGSETVSAVVCGSEPSSTTGKVTQTVSVPTSGTYTIWSRLKAPDANPVEYTVYVDGECFTIGQVQLAPGVLTWLDYENGLTSNKATIDLIAGTHTFVLTAGTANLEIDRVMLIGDDCAPVGAGDNCENDAIAPLASITYPTMGATVNGTVDITASVSDNDAISRVDFYNGVTLIASDSIGPYSALWDTTAVANDNYMLTAHAYDASGNVSTSNAVSVKVDNPVPINAHIAIFNATPTEITAGQSTTLSWSVDTGKDCVIDNGIGSVGSKADLSVTPAADTTYSMRCEGLNGGKAHILMANVIVVPAKEAYVNAQNRNSPNEGVREKVSSNQNDITDTPEKISETDDIEDSHSDMSIPHKQSVSAPGKEEVEPAYGVIETVAIGSVAVTTTAAGTVLVWRKFIRKI